MSNTRDNIPEMDYYELRRQREEYKQRMRMDQNAEKRSFAMPAEPAEETFAEPVSVEPQPEFIEEQPKAAPVARDAFEAAIEDSYEDFDEGEDFDDAEEDIANPNPFDSFINFFHGMKSSISARRGKEEELDDLDDLTDEELAELEAEEFGDAPVRPARKPRRAERSFEDEEADADEEGAMDIGGDMPARAMRRQHIETDFDEGEEFIDDDFEDEDEDYLPPKKSGFKKFMGLFVEREDEADDYDDEDEEDFEEDDFEASINLNAMDEEDDIDDLEDEDIEEEAPRRKGFFGRLGRKGRMEEEEDFEEEENDAADEDFLPIREFVPFREPEGGKIMEEKTTPVASAPQQSAAPAEGTGMTRRERRELAMRLAAEEAARKAQEDAARKAEEDARAAAEKPVIIEPLFADEAPEAEKVDMAAFEDAPTADILVETTAEEVPAEEVEEPTRKFTPVNMRAVQEAAQEDIFDVDDEDDEEDDDEDEIVEKKPRFSLFGKKKAKAEDDDEDDEDDYEDDDYDDDDSDDEDDEDEEEDEIVEKKPRRGLFGRKKARDEEDDEEEEDEEEDEYEDDDSESDDEDDEYDEYDDDEDEYDDDENEYDDDDDEPRRSFGHHLIGIFNFILGVVLALLIALLVFNFLYMVGKTTIVDKAHSAMGDTTAFNLLFPSYNLRATLPVEEVEEIEVELEAEITAEPTALPAPEATVAVPNLDGAAVEEDANIVAAPVIEAAPVVEAAPALPASGSVG